MRAALAGVQRATVNANNANANVHVHANAPTTTGFVPPVVPWTTPLQTALRAMARAPDVVLREALGVAPARRGAVGTRGGKEEEEMQGRIGAGATARMRGTYEIYSISIVCSVYIYTKCIY